MSIDSYLAAAQARINQQLTAILEQRHGPSMRLHAAMKHALLLGGKRVRPFLTLATGKICGADEDDLLQVAAALECIHTFSLVHDDLPAMDDDALRRGQPTCHVEFDEATAILAGDALHTLAFELLSDEHLKLSPSQIVQVTRTLALATGDRGMCGGQALDLVATGHDLTEHDLQQVHNYKTGALIRAAVNIGVICGNDDAQNWAADFDEFAAHLGLAFQVQDDILDVTATTATLGKPQGSDIEANKATYVRLLGLDGAQQRLEQLHHKALHALARIPYNTDTLEAFAEVLLTRKH